MTTPESIKLNERIDKLYEIVSSGLGSVSKSQHEQAVAFKQLETVVQRSLMVQEKFDSAVTKEVAQHSKEIVVLQKDFALLAARVPMDPASANAVREEIAEMRQEQQTHRDFQKKFLGGLIVLSALMSIVTPIITTLVVRWIIGG